MMEGVQKDFGEKVAKLSPKLISRAAERIAVEELEGIVEKTERGPLITAPGALKLTHYEAIGLLLYASADMMNTAAQISKLLRESGIGKVMVPARMNEMRTRRWVYKPWSDQPYWKLTSTGMEEVKRVISRIVGSRR